MHQQKLQRKCACSHKKEGEGECEDCKKKKESKLSRAPANGQQTGDVPSIVYDVLQSPGRPLDAAMRNYMEPRFGHDFSQVRVHADDRAGASARAVNALAYTVGQDIVFDAGQYTAATQEGRQLLAHELTHTMQQGAAGPTDHLTIDAADSSMEKEAAHTSETLTVDNSARAGSSARAASQMISRADPDAVGFTVRQGLAARTGVQFSPANLTDTVVGPVIIQGGLQNGGADRVNVIIGENMTIRRLARILLPLWTTATPFTPPGAAAPLPLDIITEDELAQALLMYNDTYLPMPAMTNWRAGLRFPLPIRLTGTVGTLHPLQIKALASGFQAAHAPLLDLAAPGVVAAPAATLQQDVTDFLARETTSLGRGIHLEARALTNATAELPFIREVFRQAAADRFDIALAFMSNIVNTQVTLLASQRDGNAILTEIRNALAAAPATPTTAQQEGLTRANLMLGLVAAPPALAPPASARNRAEKTITIDTLRLDGSTANIARDIAMANAILSQCNVRVVHGIDAGPPVAPASTTQTLLGGDTDLRAANSCGTPSAEERRLFRDGAAQAGFNARFRAFYVASFTNVAGAAYSCPPFTSPNALIRNTVVMQNGADAGTLAHELGHILINTDHITGPALMDATPNAAGTQIPAIRDAHCTRLYNNA
jgi:hypothetical protein